MNYLKRQKTFALKAQGLADNHLRGIASVAGVLDSYDDVILPGAFTDEVLADFLATGFVADGHDWRQMIAMPTVAEVRGVDLYTEAEFHSTDDAQAIRTKCAERIERGLSVGLSVGFSMASTDYKSFATGAALLKWAEGAGYSLADLDTAAISACARRCSVIVKVAKLYEYSVVAAPANPQSWATEVKAEQPVAERAHFTRGEYLGDWAEGYAAFDALCSLTSDLKYGPFWDAVFGVGACEGFAPADRVAYIEGALAEYASLTLRIASALIGLVDEASATDATQTDDTDLVEMADELKARCRARLEASFSTPTIASDLPAGSLASQAEAALAAVEAVSGRLAALKFLREKEGRALSYANRTRLQQLQGHVRAIERQITPLLKCTDPPASGAQNAPDPARLAALRVSLLRAQNRRLLEGITRAVAIDNMP